MSLNPYVPPKSVVADPDLRPEVTPRPHSVSFATGLLWLAVALRSINALIAWLGPNGPELSSAIVLVPLFGVLLWSGMLAVITHNIYRGRHWARLALALMVTLAVLSFPLNARRGIDLPLFTTALLVFISALLIVALSLTFTRDGARWFRRGKDSSEGVA